MNAIVIVRTTLCSRSGQPSTQQIRVVTWNLFINGGDAMPLNPKENTLRIIWGTFCEHAIFFLKIPKPSPPLSPPSLPNPPSPKWKESWPLGCILGNNYISSLLSEKNFYALKYSSSIVSTYFTTSLAYLRFRPLHVIKTTWYKMRLLVTYLSIYLRGLPLNIFLVVVLSCLQH